MSESDEYVIDSIKSWIWSGFYDRDEVLSMIDDIVDEETNIDFVRSTIDPEFDRKLAAEATWPDETDCDRLDEAFVQLSETGVIALHNTGMTMSDGLSDVAEALHEIGRARMSGYCFYHGQDVERAVGGGGLMIAFGGLDDDQIAKEQVGRRVKQSLEEHGLKVEWSGDPETRLSLPAFDWKRRGVE